jgi:processive 1,2-diacylglycerol beta-glucosyltransferase
MSGRPLLCELHAHSTWSDGDLSLPELVDLYGTSGFDVLCITDHVGRSGAEWHDPRWRITGGAPFADYLAEIEQEAWRADVEYGLILIPGLELTYDDHDPAQSAHAVAIGLRTPVSLNGGLDRALEDARDAGAALVAAHPYSQEEAARSHRGTGRWAAEGRALAPLVDRYELVNRRDLFPWVTEAGLPGVASGDFHRPEHLWTWKTLLPCVASETAVVRYLRSELPAYLVDLAEPARVRLAA